MLSTIKIKLRQNKMQGKGGHYYHRNGRRGRGGPAAGGAAAGAQPGGMSDFATSATQTT